MCQRGAAKTTQNLGESSRLSDLFQQTLLWTAVHCMGEVKLSVGWYTALGAEKKILCVCVCVEGPMDGTKLVSVVMQCCVWMNSLRTLHIDS